MWRRLGSIALIAVGLLSGCTSRQTTEGVFTIQSDSTRWADPSRPVPYAMTWEPEPGLKTMNLWSRGKVYFDCGLSPSSSGVGRFSVVFRATLPATWTFGDTVRGTAVSASVDSPLVLSGGSLWAVRDGNSLSGEAVTTVLTPCGAKSDTTRFTLQKEE